MLPAKYNSEEREQINQYLEGFLTNARREKIHANLLLRTRHLTVALEDIYQSHNASAVLRSCDCFGLQDVHIIENNNKYEVNPDVALGSSKWLTLHRYNEPDGDNTRRCLLNLKQHGYRIYATTPHKDDVTPDTLPLDEKVALVFGTELKGLTSIAMDMADGHIRIPMYGFTESLNISVSAAILMQNITHRLRNSSVVWQLSPADRAEVLTNWLSCSVKDGESLIRRFLEKIGA